MSAPQVEIISRTEDHIVAVFGQVLLQIWIKNVSYEAATMVDQAGDRLSAKGAPYVTLIVVAADCKPPQARAREILTSFAQRHAPALVLGVQVVEASGLKGAIMRSIMTGMSMIVRTVPAVIVKNLDDGVRALDGHAIGVSTDAVAATVRELRAMPPSTGASAPSVTRPAARAR